jgi:ERF superfamily
MKVYQAIQNVMRDIGTQGISKGRRNQQQGYQFRGIDDVYNELNPIMVAHGLLMLPRVLSSEQVERQTKSGGALFYTRINAEFDFVSAEDGSKHVIATVGEAMDSADKSSNKAMAAAYKYAAMMAFCIPTQGDNDADAQTPDVAPKSKADARPLYTKLLETARSFDNAAALAGWFNTDASKEERAALPLDWRATLKSDVMAMIEKLKSAEDTFPGDMPSSKEAA